MMSIYQLLEIIDQEKNGYLSVCVNKSRRREQDGGNVISTLATMFICLLNILFLLCALLQILLNFWSTDCLVM